jgi:probable rRNA maturation factor
MTLTIENEYDQEISFDYETVARQVMDTALDQENCPYEAEVSLVLTTGEEIRRVNREFRDIDKETDVLSFPMIPFPSPADYGIIEDMEDDCFNPDTGELLLGDIMISVPRMMEQAKSYGHSQLREFAFLVAHSMLHLLGYDHMVPEETAVMEEKQEAVLERLQIKR